MPARTPKPLIPRPPIDAGRPARAGRTDAVRVRDVIAKPGVCCEPLTPLREAARLLAANGCGAVPVLEPGSRRPLGVIASRDIVCRVLASGRDARRLRVVDAMTEPVVTVRLDASVNDAADLMERHGVPRLVAVDAADRCAGVVALSDLVHSLPLARLGALLAGSTPKRAGAPPTRTPAR